MKNVTTSFVEGSNDSLFSIHNLPYGIFRCGAQEAPRVGVSIGDYVLDLALLEQKGLINAGTNQSVFNCDSLNLFASLGSHVGKAIRQRLQSLLSIDNVELQDNTALLEKVLIPKTKTSMLLPFKIGGFTDFYASEHHATNVGKLFRANENALLPNWKHLPVAYNGRASTVFPSGTSIMRPKGQIKPSPDAPPIFAPSRKLDFELELGVFIGVGNADRNPISLAQADDHIFGCVLLNDWSARDVQAFEYQPLGPFLAKSFGTSISPWVVPFEVLKDVMSPLPKQIPQPVSYLYQEVPKQPDIHLMVEIQPAGSSVRTKLCETRSLELYWSLEQMLAHHTVNNCILNSGDLLGTGTISGAEKSSWGSLLELTFNGKEPLQLNGGVERTFLEDGDIIIMTGFCETAHGKIGFGSVEGTILPAQ